MQAAAGGGEPSDAIRAVNALLTQLDQLRRFPNVMVLTTSNITEAIDVAFVDRADIKVGCQGLQQGQYACSMRLGAAGCCGSKGTGSACMPALMLLLRLRCGVAALSLGVCMVVAVLQAYLGPPSAAARYEILRSGVLELARAGLIAGAPCLVEAPLMGAEAARVNSVAW